MIRSILLAVVLAPSLALAAPSISKVNGSVRAEAGNQYDELSTVNGSIRIEKGAVVDSAETVNGGIVIGDQAVVGLAETVNGGIRLGAGARVERDATTVNGKIGLDPDSEVAGRVETVNGTISLDRARVGGDIETVSGSVLIGEDSTVRGGIWVRKPSMGWFSNWGKKQLPRIEIAATAVVEGDLRIDHEVELIVHSGARIGAIVGDAADSVQVERR